MASLNSVFKKTFGEVLKDKGYKAVKGRQPYLVRVVGGEIVQVITVRNCWCGEAGYKKFEILGGIVSVYRESIDLTQNPSKNIGWLVNLSKYYKEMNLLSFNNDYRVNLMGFAYKDKDDISLQKAMDKALQETEKHMLGVLENVESIEQYMDYLDMFNPPKLVIAKYDEEKGGFVGDTESEGFLYIKTDNHEDFIKENEEKLSQIKKEIEAGLEPGKWSSMEMEARLLEEARVQRIQRRDYIYAHSELHKWVLNELEQRRLSNIEVLSLYSEL